MRVVIITKATLSRKYYKETNMSALINRVQVDVAYNPSDEEFTNNIQKKRRPCVLRGVNIGECNTKWTPEYLQEAVGSKPVKILYYENHQQSYVQGFNPTFEILPFNEAVKRCYESRHDNFFKHETESYYIRAVGESGEPSKLHKQFPELVNDIKFPNFFTKEQFHSSTLRIASANMQLLTHYDVMDNILMQVRGKKRVVLFEPKDAENIYSTGYTSLVGDIDNPNLKEYPKFANATQYEAILDSGDIVFIPALWYHNVTTLDPGIAANVFWKNLDPELYSTADLFNNNELIPITKAIDSLKNNIKLIKNLPPEWQANCRRRMVDLITSNLPN